MHWPPSEYFIYAHLAATVLTAMVWAWVRPPTPPRIASMRGVLRLAGNWAYWVTRPMLRGARGLRVNPTGLTLVGLCLALACGLACAQGQWGWAGICLVWSGICDLLDGELARSGQQSTAAGAFLDSVCDRLGEVAVFVGIAASARSPALMLMSMAAMAASLMVSYTRARGEGLGVSCPGGGLERPGRMVLMMVSMLVGTAVAHEAVVAWVEVAISMIAVGATGTALMRTVAVHQLLQADRPSGLPATPHASTKGLKEHASLYRNVL